MNAKNKNGILIFLFISVFLLSNVIFAQEKPNPKYDAIFVGDQHVLELEKIDRDMKNLYIGEDGKGLTWLKKNNRKFIDQNVEKGSNMFYILGFNEVRNTYQADAYASYLNAAAKEVVKKGGKVFYVSVNPVDAEKAQTDLNPKIDEWNKILNTKLSKNITFIDTNSVFKKEGFSTLNNGYLLNEDSSKKFLSLLLKQAGLMTIDEKNDINKPKPQEIKTKNGWGTDKTGKRVYYNEKEEIVKNGVYTIDGAKYLLDENGYYKVGLQQIDGLNYYFNSVGVMKFGWVNENDKWMLFSDKGPQLYGWQTVGKDLYYIGKDGFRLTGWWNLGTTLHYFNEDGTVGHGITPVDDEVYYFNEKGSVKVGWIEENGEKYYFGEGGPMVTGKHTIAGSVYYFADDGKMYKGFRTENDGIRYYGNDGVMVTGPNTIDGVEYFFDDGGLMKTGYVTNTKGEELYFSKDGKLANGIETVDEDKILFENGKTVTGWYTEGKNNYYFDKDGKMVHDTWITIDEKEYYFDENGIYYTGKHNLDGYKCTFDENGVLIKKTALWIMPTIVISIIILIIITIFFAKTDAGYNILEKFVIKPNEKKKRKK